jgi:hypothetical protein
MQRTFELQDFMHLVSRSLDFPYKISFLLDLKLYLLLGPDSTHLFCLTQVLLSMFLSHQESMSRSYFKFWPIVKQKLSEELIKSAEPSPNDED